QWNEASAKTRDAYLLRPGEPESWRAIARFLSRTQQSAIAFGWWRKVGERRLSIEDRRDYAGSAIAASELATAARQIDQLFAQPGGPTPLDFVLAGQLAVRRGDTPSAVDYAERTITDKRAKPNEILSAAILILGVTKPDPLPYADAWKHIEDLARDSGNAASRNALVFLAGQQSQAPVRPSAGNESSTSFGLGAPAPQQSAPSSPLTGGTSLSLAPGA